MTAVVAVIAPFAGKVGFGQEFVSVFVSVCEQPNWFVVVTVYVPAASSVRLFVVAPFDQRYVKVWAAPVCVTVCVIFPLFAPEHVSFFTVADSVKSPDGVLAIVTEVVAVQLFASVAVTECGPAARFVAVAVVWPLSQT